MSKNESIDLGWKKLSIKDAKWKHSFASLIDYSPDSSSLSDAIGDHYDIYETADGSYIFKYTIIGQKEFMAPGHVAAEGFFPIPRDIEELLINRNANPVVVNDTKTTLDIIVGLFSDWIDEMHAAIS